ncbi:hypothetical protein KCP70_12285 [Salmonella enterica subsp. enterica]|nr:hypothetical protein KCP70_12285 [Salmonella enterica subsp. enterica]
MLLESIINLVSSGSGRQPHATNCASRRKLCAALVDRSAIGRAGWLMLIRPTGCRKRVGPVSAAPPGNLAK